MESKVCRICGEDKPLSEYQKCSGYYRTECKECGKVLRKQSYIKNADKRRAKARECNAKNPERVKENAKKYREENKEHIQKYSAEYRKNNPEIMKQSHKRWAAENKEYFREFDRRRYRENPERRKASVRKRRAAKLNALGEVTPLQVISMLQDQNSTCVYCGGSLEEGYHVDHIFPLSTYQYHGIENVQLLCPTCNLRKSNIDSFRFEEAIGFLTEARLEQLDGVLFEMERNILDAQRIAIKFA